MTNERENKGTSKTRERENEKDRRKSTKQLKQTKRIFFGPKIRCEDGHENHSSRSSSGIMLAYEGDSKQHTRSSRPAAEATAGEAVDLDGLFTVAGAAASPGASTHGPAAEALLEGAEHGTERKIRRRFLRRRRRRRWRECSRQDRATGVPGPRNRRKTGTMGNIPPG